MSEQPKKKPTVLTRLRIDEVSMVDRGAGAGCKVVISKRADDDAKMPTWQKRYWQEMGASPDFIAQQEREYERIHGTGHADHEPADDDIEVAPTPADDPSRFLFSKETFLRKTYADDARGDEATREDEAVPVDELDDGAPPPPPDGASGGVPKKHRPVAFDNTDGTRMQFPNERSLAEWLAIVHRIRKSTSTPEDTMSEFKTKLHDLAKRAGVVAICKVLVEEDRSFGITEPELTDLVIAEAKKNFPELTEAQAFARVYSDQSEQGVILRKAFAVAKNAAFQDAVDESAEACAELAKIGAERWPSLTKAQQFARAAETNPTLLAKAHRRPSPFTSFPFPRG